MPVQFRLIQLSESKVGLAQHAKPQVGASQTGGEQNRRIQIGKTQIGLFQVGETQVGAQKLRRKQAGAAQVGVGKDCKSQIGAIEIGAVKVGVVKIGGKQIRAEQISAREIALGQVRPDEIGPRQFNQGLDLKKSHPSNRHVAHDGKCPVGPPNAAGQPIAGRNPVRQIRAGTELIVRENLEARQRNDGSGLPGDLNLGSGCPDRLHRDRSLRECLKPATAQPQRDQTRHGRASQRGPCAMGPPESQ